MPFARPELPYRPSRGIYCGSSLKSVIEPKPRTEEKRKFPLSGLFSETGPESGAWGTQDMVEPVLLQAAKERGVDARFYTECLGVKQDGEKVTATLKSREMAPHILLRPPT